MPRFVARLLSVVIPLLVWVSAGVSPAAAVETTSILLVVNDAAPNKLGQFLGGDFARRRRQLPYTVAQLSRASIAGRPQRGTAGCARRNAAHCDASRPIYQLCQQAAGGLVAMRPDAQLNAVLGLGAGSTTLDNAYFKIEAGTTSGSGLQTVTLPLDGSAKRYTLAGGAQAVATLYSNRDTATTNPAVVRFGNTATWSYDLARSVAYARQGDPANAGVDDDGLPGLRTIDVFFDEIDKDRVSAGRTPIFRCACSGA